MKCLVCGSDEVNKKTGECPGCGFEMISWTGSGEQGEYLQIMEEMAKDYHADLRKEISVELLVPSYERNSEGNLNIKSEDFIVLAGKEEEKPGTVKWYPERFARMDAGEKICLRLSIKRTSGKELKKEVEMTAPDWGSVFWKIGILEEEKLHFRLVLGSEENDGSCLESEKISMVC